MISASSIAESISIATAKKVIESLSYGGEFAGTLKEKCGRLKNEIESMLYDTFCEEDDWSYDDGVKYIQENIDLKYLMDQFDEGEKREIWSVCNVDDVSAFLFYQKARRDYTEIAVARKNIDIILDRDHDGVHDFLERDERERSK